MLFFQSPCKLQHAYTSSTCSPSRRENSAFGLSSGDKCLIWMPLSDLRQIYSIKCAGSIGCSVSPTCTNTLPSFASNAGTCFSIAASVVPASNSFIFSPQQERGAPEL